MNATTPVMVDFCVSTRQIHVMDKEKIITVAIIIGIFGGLVGGPILSLTDYYAPPESRFWTFIIPEFIGFACLILIIIWDKSKKESRKSEKLSSDDM